MKTTKILALLLAVVTVFGLCACAKDVRGTIGNDEEEAQLEPGSASGKTYTNRFLGIGCTLKDGWTFSTDEQIAELNGNVQKVLGDDYKKMVEKTDIVYDMGASDGNGNSFNVNITNMGLAFNLIYSEEDFARLSMEQTPQMMASAGFDVTDTAISTVTFAGAQHTAIAITATYNGVTVFERIVCIKKGSYMACVTFAVLDKADIDGLCGTFYGL